MTIEEAKRYVGDEIAIIEARNKERNFGPGSAMLARTPHSIGRFSRSGSHGITRALSRQSVAKISI